MAVSGSRVGERHSALRVHLVGEVDEERAEIRSLLTQVSDPALEVLEVAPPLLGEGAEVPDLAMVIFGGNEAPPLGYLQAQIERSPRPVIFALLQERSPTLMRRVLHAGADEILFLPLESGDLDRSLLKFTESRRREDRAVGGYLYSVTSLTGGAGVTSITANLALALRNSFDKGAAVVDLDLQDGGLSVFLHLQPTESLVSLVEFTRTLDSIKLESALTKHPSGIYLLAAPKRIEDSERISDLTVGVVLDLMRQLFDFVIVDCGHRVDEIAVAAWERSDELIYVLDQTLIAAHSANRFMDLFRQLGVRVEAPRFVLNKADSLRPISEEAMLKVLGAPLFGRISRSARLFEKMQLRTSDLWKVAPNSGLARAIVELARRLNARHEPEPETAGGLIARLFSSVGARA